MLNFPCQLNPQSQQLIDLEAWDYCHYRHKVLDYLLQTMNNSPHLRTYHAYKGTIILMM